MASQNGFCKMLNAIKARRRTDNAGFSLVAVTALGVVTMMWVFAMSASILPMYQRAAGGKYTTILRSATEAGLDWAVSQINSSISNGAVTSSLVNAGWQAVPPTAIGNNGATVSVRVVQQSPPLTSAIYEAYSTQAHWFVVTGMADYAGMQKKIRVVLAPKYVSGSGNNPYFRFGMFGQKSVNLGGNARTDGYNYNSSVSNPYGGGNIDALGGDVGSNATPMPTSGAPVNLTGNAHIGGSLMVFQGGSSTLATGTANTTIQNQIVSNGTSGGGNVSGFSGSNVINDGSSLSPPRNVGGSSAPAIINSSNNPAGSGANPLTPYNLPAPLGIPSGSTVVNPTITQTGTGGNAVFTVAQPAANTVVNLSAFSQTGNQVWNIPPGDYELSSLSTAGNGQINLVPGSNGEYGMVRFFVGGNSSTNVVQISGNGVVNGSAVPGNFQIWYGGSQNIQLSGNGNLHGVVYAPKANINVSGNGSIFGAVVGYAINNVGNGYVHFDQALANANNQWASYNTQTLSALQTITWQEPRSAAEQQNW